MAKPTVDQFPRLRADDLVPPEMVEQYPHWQHRGSVRCVCPSRRDEVMDYELRGDVAVVGPLAVPMVVGARRRVYFVCLGCQQRVRDLYLRHFFLCRRCHGLSYRSQRRNYPLSARAIERLADEVQELLVHAEEMEPLAALGTLPQHRNRHPGKTGRPTEKRAYQHDTSRRARLGPQEAYCCRCRCPRPYRYPRRVVLRPQGKPEGEGAVRTAIRARCRVCDAPVFRIVSPALAEGLQVAHPQRPPAGAPSAPDSRRDRRRAARRLRDARRRPIDLELVERLAGALCTNSSIAQQLGMSMATFWKRKRRDPALAEAIERGRAMARVRLRVLEWKAAEAGSERMLIWLGKQYLGQRESPRPPRSDSDLLDRIEGLLDSEVEEERVREETLALLATRPPQPAPEEPPREGA
jgi:hypothetical protein